MQVDVNKLKIGNILSEHQFYTVNKIFTGSVLLTNDKGEQINVTNDIVENDMFCANLAPKGATISRTDLIEIIKTNPSTAMTINFNKKVKEQDSRGALYNLYANKKGVIISEKIYQQEVNKILHGLASGEERTIRGRHYNVLDAHGRLNFIDMEQIKEPDKIYDTRFRLVDLRTINWAIIKNVKYIVK